MGQRVHLALPPNIQFGIQVVLVILIMIIHIMRIKGDHFLALRVHCLVQIIILLMVLLIPKEILKCTQRVARLVKVLRSM